MFGEFRAFHQGLERRHGFAVDQITGQGGDSRTLGILELFGNGGERLGPTRRLQPAVATDPRPIEALALQAVIGETALVGKPFLVHVLVQARQDPHHLGAPRIDADVAADGVEDVDGFGVAQFPGTRG